MPQFRQKSYFRPDELDWLEEHYHDADVQERLAQDQDERFVKRAAELLAEKLRTALNVPGPGESEESFQKRLKNASKERRHEISRVPAETEEEFTKRRESLTDVSILRDCTTCVH